MNDKSALEKNHDIGYIMIAHEYHATNSEATMSETLTQIDLTPAEIAQLPAAIRRKIEAAFSPANKANGQWMLIGVQTAASAIVVGSAIAQVERVAAAHAAARQERNIERLLEIFAEDQPRSDLDAELELENAQMRAEYLAETPLLTAAQVRDQSGLKPRNKSEPASRWKRERKIFAVRKGGVDFYPAFQFEDGAPMPVIKQVLTKLPKDMSVWQIAFWFDTGNGWLDGQAPQECLGKPEGVLHAAQQIAEPAFG